MNQEVLSKIRHASNAKSALKKGYEGKKKHHLNTNDTLQLGSIFKQNTGLSSDKNYLSEVPSMFKDNSRSQMDADHLKQEGHPLEKPYIPNEKKKNRKKTKRYIEKFRRELLKFTESNQEDTLQ